MSAADHLQPAQHDPDPDQLSLFDMPATPAPARQHNPAGRSGRQTHTPPPRKPPRINPMLQGGYQFKLFVDPEEHMAEMQSSSDAYGGTAHDYQSTMRSKLIESQMPKGMTHGGGLFDALHNKGEQVRKPAHVIIDPTNYGQPDPYNRQGPMQWEGHHRIAAAAESQRQSREAGVENYHKYVPVEYHQTAGHAINARYSSSWPLTTEPGHTPDHDYDDDYSSVGNDTYWRTAEKSPTSHLKKQRRNGSFGTGTWNSKAY